jgi:hypothetical protein
MWLFGVQVMIHLLDKLVDVEKVVALGDSL